MNSHYFKPIFEREIKVAVSLKMADFNTNRKFKKYPNMETGKNAIFF